MRSVEEILGGRGGSTTSLVLVTMAALYLLGIMYFIGQGGFRGALADASVNEIELLALACNGQARLGSDAGADTSCPAEPASSPNERDVGKPSPTPALEPSPVPAPTSSPASAAPSRDGTAFRDRFSKQMAAVREFYGLSAREAEVAELIARGNTVAHIAELLFVSENTVRTHSKRIYVKLDVHKRQELIDLVERFEPEGR